MVTFWLLKSIWWFTFFLMVYFFFFFTVQMTWLNFFNITQGFLRGLSMDHHHVVINSPPKTHGPTQATEKQESVIGLVLCVSVSTWQLQRTKGLLFHTQTHHPPHPLPPHIPSTPFLHWFSFTPLLPSHTVLPSWHLQAPWKNESRWHYSRAGQIPLALSEIEHEEAGSRRRTPLSQGEGELHQCH